MYDWVLHWAETPYGPAALFLLAFAESSFFPIPPDVLLIALAISIPLRAFRFAAIAAVGSLLGGIFGYGIGWKLWWSGPNEFSAIANFFLTHIPGFTVPVFEKVRSYYDQYNFWVVFTAGFTPIPYKVITISAGAFNINFAIFVLASAISRSARFFLVAALIYKFGPRIKGFIDRYFNLLSIAFVVLLILGFLVIGYLGRG
jgi:membrane protein YqaA with SNARE-associated domain